MSVFAVPPHVPEHLVRDFDFLATPRGDDFFHAWAALHNGPDIFYSPHHGGHWVLTRYADIEHVMSDYRAFSSRYQTLPKEGRPIPFPPIETDPPQHDEFRRLIAPFFSPKSIGALEIRARDLTRSLLDRLAPLGGCDFHDDFALHMPIGIFMHMAGLPLADRLFVLKIAHDIVRGSDEEHGAAAQVAFDYLGKKIAERRRNPGSDLLSAVVQGRVQGGRPLTDEEVLGMTTLLLVGGLDTVAGMLTFFAHFLAEHPQHRRQLVDNPKLVNPAVEEMMRRHHIANVSRMVVGDIVYKGVAMKAGDMVLTATSFAGIDDRRYRDPFTVDFDRGDNKNLVFGRGPHQCIGAFLARTELRVFVHEWLARIPDFAVAAGKKPVIAPGRASAVTYLPLVWPTAGN